MAEYHVSAGLVGIYTGKTNKNGTEWIDKSDVTDEALRAVRDYIVDKLQANNKTQGGYEWNRKDGKIVELLVRIKEKENNVWTQSKEKLRDFLIWWNNEMQHMSAINLKWIKFNGLDYFNFINPDFNYEDFCFMLQDPWGDYSKIEVIGNIFDNPELLEV